MHDNETFIDNVHLIDYLKPIKNAIERPHYGSNHQVLQEEMDKQIGLLNEVKCIQLKVKNDPKISTTLNRLIESNNSVQENLEYLAGITNLQNLLNDFSVNATRRSVYLSMKDVNRFNSKTNISDKVNQSWQLVERFSQLSYLHLKNAHDYHQFYHDCKQFDYDMNETFKRISKKIVKSNWLEVVQSTNESKEMLSVFKESNRNIESLKSRLKDLDQRSKKVVIPIYKRFQDDTDISVDAVLLCDYQLPQITLRCGDHVNVVSFQSKSSKSSDGFNKKEFDDVVMDTNSNISSISNEETLRSQDQILKRSDTSEKNPLNQSEIYNHTNEMKNYWKISTANGVQAMVPSICLWLSGPDHESIEIFQDLRKTYIQLWKDNIDIMLNVSLQLYTNFLTNINSYERVDISDAFVLEKFLNDLEFSLTGNTEIEKASGNRILLDLIKKTRNLMQCTKDETSHNTIRLKVADVSIFNEILDRTKEQMNKLKNLECQQLYEDSSVDDIVDKAFRNMSGIFKLIEAISYETENLDKVLQAVESLKSRAQNFSSKTQEHFSQHSSNIMNKSYYSTETYYDTHNSKCHFKKNTNQNNVRTYTRSSKNNDSNAKRFSSCHDFRPNIDYKSSQSIDNLHKRSCSKPNYVVSFEIEIDNLLNGNCNKSQSNHCLVKGSPYRPPSRSIGMQFRNEIESKPNNKDQCQSCFLNESIYEIRKDFQVNDSFQYFEEKNNLSNKSVQVNNIRTCEQISESYSIEKQHSKKVVVTEEFTYEDTPFPITTDTSAQTLLCNMIDFDKFLNEYKNYKIWKQSMDEKNLKTSSVYSNSNSFVNMSLDRSLLESKNLYSDKSTATNDLIKLRQLSCHFKTYSNTTKSTQSFEFDHMEGDNNKYKDDIKNNHSLNEEKVKDSQRNTQKVLVDVQVNTEDYDLKCASWISNKSDRSDTNDTRLTDADNSQPKTSKYTSKFEKIYEKLYGRRKQDMNKSECQADRQADTSDNDQAMENQRHKSLCNQCNNIIEKKVFLSKSLETEKVLLANFSASSRQILYEDKICSTTHSNSVSSSSISTFTEKLETKDKKCQEEISLKSTAIQVVKYMAPNISRLVQTNLNDSFYDLTKVNIDLKSRKNIAMLNGHSSFECIQEKMTEKRDKVFSLRNVQTQAIVLNSQASTCTTPLVFKHVRVQYAPETQEKSVTIDEFERRILVEENQRIETTTIDDVKDLSPMSEISVKSIREADLNRKCQTSRKVLYDCTTQNGVTMRDAFTENKMIHQNQISVERSDSACLVKPFTATNDTQVGPQVRSTSMQIDQNYENEMQEITTFDKDIISEKSLVDKASLLSQPSKGLYIKHNNKSTQAEKRITKNDYVQYDGRGNTIDCSVIFKTKSMDSGMISDYSDSEHVKTQTDFSSTLECLSKNVCTLLTKDTGTEDGLWLNKTSTSTQHVSKGLVKEANSSYFYGLIKNSGVCYELPKKINNSIQTNSTQTNSTSYIQTDELEISEMYTQTKGSNQKETHSNYKQKEKYADYSVTARPDVSSMLVSAIPETLDSSNQFSMQSLKEVLSKASTATKSQCVYASPMSSIDFTESFSKCKTNSFICQADLCREKKSVNLTTDSIPEIVISDFDELDKALSNSNDKEFHFKIKDSNKDKLLKILKDHDQNDKKTYKDSQTTYEVVNRMKDALVECSLKIEKAEYSSQTQEVVREVRSVSVGNSINENKIKIPKNNGDLNALRKTLSSGNENLFLLDSEDRDLLLKLVEDSIRMKLKCFSTQDVMTENAQFNNSSVNTESSITELYPDLSPDKIKDLISVDKDQGGKVIDLLRKMKNEFKNVEVMTMVASVENRKLQVEPKVNELGVNTKYLIDLDLESKNLADILCKAEELDMDIFSIDSKNKELLRTKFPQESAETIKPLQAGQFANMQEYSTQTNEGTEVQDTNTYREVLNHCYDFISDSDFCLDAQSSFKNFDEFKNHSPNLETQRMNCKQASTQTSLSTAEHGSNFYSNNDDLLSSKLLENDLSDLEWQETDSTIHFYSTCVNEVYTQTLISSTNQHLQNLENASIQTDMAMFEDDFDQVIENFFKDHDRVKVLQTIKNKMNQYNLYIPNVFHGEIVERGTSTADEGYSTAEIGILANIEENIIFDDTLFSNKQLDNDSNTYDEAKGPISIVNLEFSSRFDSVIDGEPGTEHSLSQNLTEQSERSGLTKDSEKNIKDKMTNTLKDIIEVEIIDCATQTLKISTAQFRDASNVLWVDEELINLIDQAVLYQDFDVECSVNVDIWNSEKKRVLRKSTLISKDDQYRHCCKNSNGLPVKLRYSQIRHYLLDGCDKVPGNHLDINEIEEVYFPDTGFALSPESSIKKGLIVFVNHKYYYNCSKRLMTLHEAAAKGLVTCNSKYKKENFSSLLYLKEINYLDLDVNLMSFFDELQGERISIYDAILRNFIKKTQKSDYIAFDTLRKTWISIEEAVYRNIIGIENQNSCEEVLFENNPRYNDNDIEIFKINQVKVGGSIWMDPYEADRLNLFNTRTGEIISNSMVNKNIDDIQVNERIINSRWISFTKALSNNWIRLVDVADKRLWTIEYPEGFRKSSFRLVHQETALAYSPTHHEGTYHVEMHRETLSNYTFNAAYEIEGEGRDLAIENGESSSSFTTN